MKVITSIIRVALFVSLLFSTAANTQANPLQKKSGSSTSITSLQVAPVSHPTTNFAQVGPSGEDMEEVAAGMRGKINWLLVVISVLLILIIAVVFDILQKVGEINGKAVINWNGLNAKLLLAFL